MNNESEQELRAEIQSLQELIKVRDHEQNTVLENVLLRLTGLLGQLKLISIRSVERKLSDELLLEIIEAAKVDATESLGTLSRLRKHEP